MDSIIESKLAGFGYKTEILSTEPSLVVRLSSPEKLKRNKIPWINMVLFIGTILSTLLAGALQENIDIFSNPGLLISKPFFLLRAGIPFSASLLAILLFHEFGHYIAARINKVNVSLPYFIPAPTIIGTFGAFIKSRSAFMNRRQLLDVAAAGPLAGLVVSIIVLIIGIRGSTVIEFPASADNVIFGSSLLHQGLTYLIKGPVPQGLVLMQNSVAFAGWVGLLVTMFNLLPIGQLDGGHIMYALFGKRQRELAYIAMFGLFVLSFWWIGWALWLFITLIMKPVHPPTLVDELPIGNGRKIVGYLAIAAFILCFMPVPIYYK